MTYKFNGENQVLEVEENSFKTAAIRIVDNEKGTYVSFEMNTNQIYDLIGALHSIQSKIKKYKKD